LVHFLVDNNKLTGTLPVFSGANALQDFDASFNALTGQLRPEWAASLGGLLTLSLRGNDLTGSLPAEVGDAKGGAAPS
jgi:hypothetical protein